jgi:hypothetical protein
MSASKTHFSAVIFSDWTGSGQLPACPAEPIVGPFAKIGESTACIEPDGEGDDGFDLQDGVGR